MAHSILVVDDEPHIREVICFALDRAGMATRTARNGQEALQDFAAHRPDLIVLDVGMPEMDGLEVCRRVRGTSDVPILFLSARNEEIDRIVGLEVGGDDYVSKPFSPREIVARIRAILKRAGGSTAGNRKSTIEHGKLLLDRAEHAVRFDGRQIALTSREFGLLAAFAEQPNRVFARDSLLESVYGGKIHVSDRTIDSHIRNLRSKFAAAGVDEIVVTVHGVGFKLGALD